MCRQWKNVELEKCEADVFKSELDSVGIKYESSESFNMIHFEVYVNEEEAQFIETYLNDLDEDVVGEITSADLHDYMYGATTPILS